MTTTSAASGTHPPLRRDAERNRQRVLAAAREVFAARGLSATLDEVAAHAGLGVGTVYRRFADKDALVDALFEESVREMVELATTALTEPDPWEGLSGYLYAACASLANDHGLREAVLLPRRACAGVALARAELVPRMSALVARAQASGQLRADVATTDIPLVLHAVQAAADLAAAARRSEPGTWRRVLASVLDGWRASRPSTTDLGAPPLTEEEVHAVMMGEDR